MSDVVSLDTPLNNMHSLLEELIGKLEKLGHGKCGAKARSSHRDLFVSVIASKASTDTLLMYAQTYTFLKYDSSWSEQLEDVTVHVIVEKPAPMGSFFGF